MLRPSRQPAAGISQPEEEALYLERVEALAPRIAESVEAIERERRIPEPLLNGMIEAGLFRMLAPRSVGGAEAHPLTFMRVVEALAGIDASTAWNVGQNAVCAITAAYLSPEAAREIFGEARTILAWGPPGPGTRAVAVDGGYRVTGNWSFASGGRHATWLGAYSTITEADGSPRLGPDGKPVRRVMLFPAEHATWTDAWHVVGLRGTASDSFALDDLFVPEAHSLNRDDLGEVREPGWLYRFAHTNLYACGFASIAVGVARAMLDAFLALAMEKTPRGYANPMRENAATQAELGEAEGRLRAVRAYLRENMRAICEEAQAGGALTLEQRMAIRLASTYTIQQAMQVGDFAYGAAGSSAIFTSGPFERRFRDLHAIGQQVQGRKSHFQTVGKFLLGMEEPGPFV